jgi:hypothetical protein
MSNLELEKVGSHAVLELEKVGSHAVLTYAVLSSWRCPARRRVAQCLQQDLLSATRIY